jgi:hypothetical protein
MSDRRCTQCRRPCSGHSGPTGPLCTLTPLKHTEVLKLNTSAEEAKSATATGGSGVIEAKLDNLSSQFEQLLSVVSTLVVRVSAVETKRSPSVDAGYALPSPVKTPPRRASVAQQLKSAVEAERLRVASVEADRVKESVPVTTKTLARDAELSRLLDTYNSDSQEGDLLRAQDAVNGRLGAAALPSSGELKTKKLYLIPDFITSNTGRYVRREDEDELVTKKGLSFKLQSKKKLDPEEVSIPQWLSANILILEKLIPTLSTEQVKDYFHYTRQVGDLLQIYTSASVFLLDDHHRHEVFEDNIRWRDVSGNLERFYLERKKGTGGNAGTSTASSSTTSGAKVKRNRFNHPCTRFNTKEGCDNELCKFMPICSYKGCRGNHPKYDHDFRTSKAGTQSVP